MAYSSEHAAAWIVTLFITNPRAEDLTVLQDMIAADLRFAYQQGRIDSLAIPVFIHKP